MHFHYHGLAVLWSRVFINTARSAEMTESSHSFSSEQAVPLSPSQITACDLCLMEGNTEMINSCWSWLRADQKWVFSHKLGQIKGLHLQPTVSVLSLGIFLSNNNFSSVRVSCGVCCQLGDLNPSWKKTIIYTSMRLGCNSLRLHLRNPYYHVNLQAPWVPLLAFRSGLLAMTVTFAVLVPNSSVSKT